MHLERSLWNFGTVCMKVTFIFCLPEISSVTVEFKMVHTVWYLAFGEDK